MFVPDLDRLPDAGGSWDRLYLGSEFCAWRLPAPRRLRRAVQEARRRGLAFTLVTPFLDEEGLGMVVELARTLPEGEGTEVVANDPGLLEALAGGGWGGTLVAGRLLTRQRRGPGVQVFGEPVPEAREALRASALDSAAYVEWLGETYGVRRFELDDLVQGAGTVPVPPGVRLSLYRPWLLVTATRNCPWIFDGRSWDRRRGCAAPCRGRTLRLEPEEGGRPLALGGCAQFLEHRSDGPLPPWVDREVHQPAPPA